MSQVRAGVETRSTAGGAVGVLVLHGEDHVVVSSDLLAWQVSGPGRGLGGAE